MPSSAGYQLSATHASRLRRSALMLLAFVYLFVGIGHNSFCADQAIASGFTIENVLNGLDDSDTKAAFLVCDHCPSCTPVVMPMPTLVTIPLEFSGGPVATHDAMRLMDHSRLDTPPPKNLT